MQGGNIRQVFYENSYLCNFPISWKIKNIKCPITMHPRITISNSVNKSEWNPLTLLQKWKKCLSTSYCYDSLTFPEGSCKAERNMWKSLHECKLFFLPTSSLSGITVASESFHSFVSGLFCKFCQGWDSVYSSRCCGADSYHCPWHIAGALWIFVEWMSEWLFLTLPPKWRPIFTLISWWFHPDYPFITRFI